MEAPQCTSPKPRISIHKQWWGATIIETTRRLRANFLLFFTIRLPVNTARKFLAKMECFATPFYVNCPCALSTNVFPCFQITLIFSPWSQVNTSASGFFGRRMARCRVGYSFFPRKA